MQQLFVFGQAPRGCGGDVVILFIFGFLLGLNESTIGKFDAETVYQKHIIPYSCQPAPEWSEHAYICLE